MTISINNAMDYNSPVNKFMVTIQMPYSNGPWNLILTLMNGSSLVKNIP